jgi:hypothetical protein
MRIPTAQSLGLGSGPAKIVPLQGRLNVTASPEAFGAGQARQIGALGQDLGQAGQQLLRVQQAVEERDARTSANKFGLEARKYWLEDSVRREQEAPPGAPGYRQQLATDYAKYREDALKDLQPGLYRDLVQDDLDRLELSLGERAITFEAQARRSKADTDQKAALGLAGSILATDPGQYAELLARQLQDIEASNMPAAWKEETARATTAALSKSMVLGLIEQEPHGTAELLRTTPMPGLEVGDQAELLDLAQRRAEALDNDRKREKVAADAEGQVALGERVDNAVALLSEGKDAGALPTLADVEAVYSPTQAPKVWAKIQDRLRTGQAVGRVAGRSFAEQDAILEGMRPNPEAPNYADQVAAFEAVRKAVDAERSALRQDPAAYTQRTNPAVAAAFEEARQDPGKTAHAIRMSLAEQERLGITPDKVAPLPKEGAGSIVERFKTAQTSDERLALLSPITLGLQDDALGRKILDQLEEAGLPPAAAIALERFREGDVGAAREILGLITADPKDAPKLGDATAKEVQAKVDAQFTEGYFSTNAAGLSARAARLVADPAMQRSLELQRSTMLRLAQSYAAQGMEAQAAADRAYKVLYGGKQALVDEEIGAVTVPAGTDRDALEDDLAGARRSLDLSHLTPRRENFPNDGAWELALRDHDQRLADLREDGQWLDGPNGGFVLVDPLLGAPVPGPDGKPRVWTLEEITGEARAPAPLPNLGPIGSTASGVSAAAISGRRAEPPVERARLHAVVEDAESGGKNVVAVDPDRAPEDRATGPMQVMPETARETAAEMGITELAGLDNAATQRWMLAHPEQARAIGQRYLDKQLDRYGGNVALAVAAYHAGAGNVDKWLERYGDPRTGRLSNREWAARIPGPKTRAYTLKILGALA